MKAEIKHLVSQAASFIFDTAIAASGLNETIDVKELVTDIFMYSYLLLMHLQNRLIKACFYARLRMANYKTLFVYLLFIPAGAAFMLHFTTAAILILFVMIAVISQLMKKEAGEVGFINDSLP